MRPVREISWLQAYVGSAVVHLAAVAVLASFLAHAVVEREQQQMYVVDLRAGDLQRAGSGHGGGGNGALFPEKLPMEAVEKSGQAHTEQAAVSAAAETVSADGISQKPSSSLPANGTAGTSGGMGSGVAGTGTGSGEGSGDGRGYGEGAGGGQGSGDSGAEGTGQAPFDSEGFWSAVNANKEYPPMAIRRGLTGTVTVTVTLDGGGNCSGAYVSGSSGQSLLDKAALKAVQAACPYPNASGQEITINVPVTFNLN